MKRSLELFRFTNTRKAVSPVIATLMLVAIAIVVSITFYIFVTGLMSSLVSIGGSQVTEQLSMDSYSFTKSGNTWTLTVTLRNTGTASVSISTISIYYDGSTTVAATTMFSSCTTPCTTSLNPQNTLTVTLQGGALNPLPHTSHVFKVVTDDGAVFAFTVIAGQSQ